MNIPTEPRDQSGAQLSEDERDGGGGGGAGSFIASAYFRQSIDLLKTGHYAEAETYLREVVRVWPGHPGALNNLGTALWRQKRTSEAEALYRRGLEIAPDDFGILNNLGNAIWEQGRPREALPFYEKALEIEPSSAETWMNLGVALSDVGRFDEALEKFDRSLRLCPGSPEALDNVGMTLARQGQWGEALDWHERALRLAPDFPEARRNRAFAWLARGDWRRGWPEHEWRVRCRNHEAVSVDLPLWRGEPLDGRTILLVAEQGLGDVLQFLRFARTVHERGARVVLACPTVLHELAARCPGVDRVQGAVAPREDCQLWSPLLSVPAAIGLVPEMLEGQAPYLSADVDRAAHWRGVLDEHVPAAGPMLKIGIAWQGNPRNRVDRWRSFRLRDLAPIARVPGVCLVNLQVGEGAEQLDEPGQDDAFSVVRPDRGEVEGARRSLMDTAAIIECLDLVIAPDTAIAHLAGGLGANAWTALPVVPEWRWMIDRDDTPWYPTMALFRQPAPGDWRGVFERMAEALAQGRGPIGGASPRPTS